MYREKLALSFGLLEVEHQLEAPVTLLENYVLPFYKASDVQVQTIMTDSGLKFYRTPTGFFESFLQQHDIKHLITSSDQSTSRSPVETFASAAREMFFKRMLLMNLSLDELRLAFGKWLQGYNSKRSISSDDHHRS